MVTTPGPQSVFVWGVKGCGRSHLCQAVYHRAEEENIKAAYVALSEEGIEPEILIQLEQYSLVILDDLDAVVGDPRWDEGLFHFYNRLKESAGCLLMTSAKAPASFEDILPDLKSRFAWELVYPLEELADADKIQALQQRARERGLILSFEAVQYLLNRLPRDTHQLFGVLEILDHQSMAQKRSLTVPFIKKILNL